MKRKETYKDWSLTQSPEVIKFLKDQYNENVSLRGSLSKYPTFEQYIETEIIN